MSKIPATLRSTPIIEREIAPPAKCFCCQDSGKVSNPYLNELVDIPPQGDIVPYICQRYDCAAGQALLKAYEMSQDERDVWYNNQVRESKGSGEGLPRPVSAADYRANFSTNLNRECCDWLHDRSYHDWRIMITTPRSPKNVAVEFAAAVSDRDRKIENIKDLLMQIEFDIAPRLEAFVQKYRDRDSANYLNWQDLPSKAHEVLITNLRSLIA